MKKASVFLAQVVQPSSDLVEEMAFFESHGFRLINIYPDDNPEVAILSGHGISIRLDRNASCAPSVIHLLTDDEAELANEKTEHKAPNGTILKLKRKSYQVTHPANQHQFEIRQLRDKEPWVIGRAGMHYRDLMPSRLGGSIMASHIRIPKGGPVPDMVHYHTIGFQLIFCYRGWVKLVYENQGEQFILEAGDCVTQPPEIRHRVLEASDNLEVIEIGVPAAHMTTIDYDMELPTKEFRPDREFQGQRFCHHKVKEANWIPWRIANFECRDTGISKATKGIASVQVARFKNAAIAPNFVHDADILFTFVMQGQMRLIVNEGEQYELKAGEAYVIPPKMKYSFSNCAQDLELLEVSLPGNFNTRITD